MEFTHASIWLIIAIALLALEILTLGFFLASLSFGALLASLVAWGDGSLEWQMAAFAAGCFLSFLFIRPFLKKTFAARGAKTNADAILDRVGVVESATKAGARGYIKIDGDSFPFECDVDLKTGQHAKVVKRDSILLTVEPKV